MLLADMLNSIFRDIIALSTHANENLRDAAVGSVVVFSLICLLVFLVTNVILFLVYIRGDVRINTKDDELSEINCNEYVVVLCRRIIIFLVQIVGALLYFYGDNIGYIIQNYSEELGCGDECVVNNRIAAVVTLGLALIILHFFPATFEQFDIIMYDSNGCDFNNWDDNTSKYNYGLEMITIIVKIDIVYTAVAIMTQTDEFCSHTDRALSITFVIICSLFGIIYMIISCGYSKLKINEGTKTLILLIVSLCLLPPNVVLYLLADNQQPLDCAFNCDTFAANQTFNEINCNAQVNSGVRLLFMLLCFCFVATLSFIWICTGTFADRDVEEVVDAPDEGDIELEEGINLNRE